MLKGRSGNAGFMLKGGDASQGTLLTMYDGPRPNAGNYTPRKEGAIILGTGGDQSNRDRGNFYEGERGGSITRLYPYMPAPSQPDPKDTW